ncbi:hypothetical protein GWI33_000510, partial [Rhynchophorus ferrugineus]
MNIQD